VKRGGRRVLLDSGGLVGLVWVEVGDSNLT